MKFTRYIPFAAAAASVITLMVFEGTLIAGRGKDAVRILAIIMFVLDFYLCAEFFAGMLRHPVKLVLRHLASPEGIIDLLSTVPVFIVSLFTVLDASGFITADNAAERSPFILFYFTAIHPYARAMYLARIVRTGTAASVFFRSDLVRAAVLRIVSVLGAALIAASVVLMMLAQVLLLPRLERSAQASTTLITYDLTGQSFIDNPFLTAEFARKYGITFVFRAQRLIFEENDAKHVTAARCLFEMQSISVNGITVIRTLPMFRLPVSMLLIITAAVYALTASLVMYTLRRLICHKVLSAVNLMRRGYDDPDLNRLIDAAKLPEEIASLAGAYNKTFLAYKYRDRFIGSLR